jgi:outer membrane protein OmpA-like peptidoglycan-associated protein
MMLLKSHATRNDRYPDRGGMRVISKLARVMEQNPERTIRIEGHTDNKGSDSYNQRLSEQRAEAVKRALMCEGIQAGRITTIGYGEAYPVATNLSSSGRQQNRRVEIIFSDKKGVVKERF